ncbi:MAG: ABC transporter ATP-binding protein, partial [Planctomycetaceae bacterium]|nr:ABC transporter ATP-binding protein [Planctomycetaceae bacterium]
MTATQGPAVEVTGLTKTFGEETAVNNLSLTIERGSTFGLIGPNGAGKTTTIKMLMGMLRPTAGTINILGRDVFAHAWEVKNQVGYVPDQHNIDRWMRVREAVAFCRSVFLRWNESTCEELLTLFEVPKEKKVKHLSKGMLFKLSLVLAVSHDP